MLSCGGQNYDRCGGCEERIFSKTESQHGEESNYSFPKCYLLKVPLPINVSNRTMFSIYDSVYSRCACPDQLLKERVRVHVELKIKEIIATPSPIQISLGSQAAQRPALPIYIHV